MSKIILYPHGGSGNHGCEALVRATAKILGHDRQIILASKHPEQDLKYGLDQLCSIVRQNAAFHSVYRRLMALVKFRLSGDSLAYERNTYKEVLKHVDSDTVCLSFGGDNYCYGKPVYLYIMNWLFRQRGAKTILWGCSIEPENIDDEMLFDLRSYNLIIARESLTYNALLDHGLTNVRIAPDPAFVLSCDKSVVLPGTFTPGNTVGINLSPMALSYSVNNDIVFSNYTTLIEHILDNTDMNIALIPHVVWSDNDDRQPLGVLFEKYKSTNRICMIGDMNCEQLKGVISQCRFLVAARTHASIAAYSMGIPTLVLGYSIKAKGIAKDLFGTWDNYVVPVRDLITNTDLTEAFSFLQRSEQHVKLRLNASKSSLLEGAMSMRDMLPC